METSEIQSRVMEEIKLIPENKLSELSDFIHFYRLGVESIGNSETEIMRFAGCREDMPDKEFEDFLEEVTERRRQAFSGRREYETFAD